MSNWVQEKSGEVVDVTQVKASEAAKMASDTGKSIQDHAVEAKDQTGSFLGEKTEAVTKGTPVAPKENVFQQASGNVVGAATDAKDAVMNTLGMGGNK